ncbi:hypothetical protein C0J52_27924 [Blattella germanica]|nr:hypothetical protein C0J52_27924 [Blattella germanica]
MMKHYRDYHPLLGIHYMKLGKISLYLNKPEDAIRMLRKAENVINIKSSSVHNNPDSATSTELIINEVDFVLVCIHFETTINIIIWMARKPPSA